MSPRRIVNALSLSRIPIALTFVLIFHRNEVLLDIATMLIVFAFATDFLDGFVARKLSVASVHGRHWDSLGDKAIYTAVIVAYSTQGILDPLIAWGLLVREIALYITRILYLEKLAKVEQIRPFTNWHGYFMYVLIVLGIIATYASVRGASLDLYPYIQAAGALALVCGIASIVHWLKLE